MKNAFITGITGQDGSFLAELLLAKGYNVFGLKRRTSSNNLGHISHIAKNITLIEGDMCDYKSLLNAIEIAKPDEIYNLAAQSNVGVSFTQPSYTLDVNARGVLYLLEAVKNLGIKPRIYQASTSELFGGVEGTAPQNERTPFTPKSPYGLSKLYAHEVMHMYRDAYDMFTCIGILFNHESERRGIEFVTRKITNAVAKIHYKLDDKLLLGNIDAKRDWGYAKDYVDAIYRIIQYDTPDDFVIATGVTHSVREFCELAFAHVGLNYLDYVKIDEKYIRQLEVNVLQGNASKAQNVLNWKATTSFEELISLMVEHDLRNVYELFNLISK